jgi:hypothetical protein
MFGIILRPQRLPGNLRGNSLIAQAPFSWQHLPDDWGAILSIERPRKKERPMKKRDLGARMEKAD